mgnify:CR=1 FL=1
MFDIGFWELSIIGVVALVVIGPERLPGLARTAGKWFGKMNRFVSSVKDDIAQEIKSEDLQKILKEQENRRDDCHEAAQRLSRSTVSHIGTIECAEQVHSEYLRHNEDDVEEKETTHLTSEQ